MRYIAAAALHAKALKVLAVIEQAEDKILHEGKCVDSLTLLPSNWREELRIWPLGKPSPREQERIKRNFEITKAAHRRLCKYYDNILSRLIDLQ
jgi:hypothetical protein